MPLATCPPAADLERLFLGGVPEKDVEALEQHVLECASCLDQVKKLCRTRDALAGVLSDATRIDVLAATAAVDDLMKKLESLRPAHGSRNQGAPMISFSCHGCQKRLSVHENLAGKKVQCPACGQVVQVHAGVAASPAGSEEPQAWSPAGAGDPVTDPPLSQPDATVGLPPPSGQDSSLTDFLAPPQAGDELGRLGKYRILKILGRGGMGVVFQAEDPKLKRSVALKAMLPALAASESAGQRFLREAQAMAAVEHDHIVRIYQVDEDRGVPYMAMEFLKGEPLDERLRRDGKLPVLDVLRIGREIAQGLSAAHTSGLIHRDIKPGNIWLETPKSRVKILDFGLARPSDAADGGLTHEGAILGTPAYMAPEQARGETVDARCDLFSLGVVLYRLCSGRQPFVGADPLTTIMEVTRHEPAAPITIDPALPQELSDLIMKLLAKDPAQRIPSAAVVVEVLDRLEKALLRAPEGTDHTEAVIVAPPRRAVAPARRCASAGSSQAPPRRRLVAIVGAAALALVATGLVLFWQTPSGTVRIEINDPKIQVAFDKKDLIFQGVDKQDLKVSPGAHGLHVKRGNLEFDTVKPIVIKKGDLVTLRIEWLKDGKLQVVQGEKVIGAKELPKVHVAVVPPPRTDAIVQKFQGHTDVVSYAALSANGKYAVTGSWDGTASLWDAASGKKIQSFNQGLPKWLNGVALTDDGKLVLTGSHDGTAILWEAASGKRIQTFQRHTGEVLSVALSGDGKLVLTGSKDKTAILWDAASGKKIQTFQGHTDVVHSVALSGDGKLVATGSKDKTAILWDAASGKKIQTFQEHTDMVLSVALKGDGKVVLTGSRDGRAILWEAASGKKIQAFFQGDNWRVTSVALSADGKLVVTGSDDNKAFLWEAASGKKIQTFQGHTGAVWAVAIGADGKHVLTGSVDKTAILWAVNAAPGPWQPLLDAKLASWSKYDSKQPDAITVADLAGEPVLRFRKSPKQAFLTSKQGVHNQHLRLEFQFPTGKGNAEFTVAPVPGHGKSGITLTVATFGQSWAHSWGGVRYTEGFLERGAVVAKETKPREGTMYIRPPVLEPAGAWNRLDLVRLEDSLVCFINGRFVGALTGIRQMKDGAETDFGNTPINLECTKGEVLVRRIEVRDISALPPELLATAPFPPLDPAWLKAVAAMKVEQQVEAVKAELMKRNPGFDGKIVMHKMEAGVVTELHFLTDNVTDISPVQALTGLLKLTVPGTGDHTKRNGKLADLSPLKDMNLTSLNCNHTAVSDLAPLKGVKLTYLNCDSTQVSDLSPLRDMKLTKLYCLKTKVSDLSPLKDMKLTTLVCDYTRVSDLSPLKDMPLTWLSCAATPVSDLSPLKGIKLTTLGCNHTQVSDLSPLRGMPLKKLSCDFKHVRDTEILRPIKTLEIINEKPAAEFWREVDAERAAFDAWVKQVAAMKAEQQVEAVKAELMKRNPGFDGTVKERIVAGVVTDLTFLTDKVTDISPVRALTRLRWLSVDGSRQAGARNGKLADLSPLKDLKLIYLHCDGTQVSDLAPLKDMKLENLSFGRTEVSDLSPLKDMKLRYLTCAKVSDLSPLKGMPLKEVWCDFKAGRDTEILRSIKTLEKINGTDAREFLQAVDAKKLEKTP